MDGGTTGSEVNNLPRPRSVQTTSFSNLNVLSAPTTMESTETITDTKEKKKWTLPAEQERWAFTPTL
ncbi:MAG: hypothetical protein Q9196_001240, partial [Gyalolechia fulgens]